MITNFNPIQLFSMMKQSGNPQQFVCNLIEEKMGDNPFFSNILSLAKSGKGDEIEAIARNMMKERGLDYDKEFNSFKKNLKL